jgi:hypothetical protein
MNMRFLVLIAVIVCTYSAHGQPQTCTCESNFAWLKSTFEENDAGFQYAIDTKGQVAYNAHNQATIEKIKTATTTIECLELLSEWLTFFRLGHIGIEPSLRVLQSIPQTNNYTVNLAEFEQYIVAKTEFDYEGIWEEIDNQYIGIRKVGNDYVGFTISSAGEQASQLKLQIQQQNEKWETTVFRHNRKPEVSGKPELIGKNYLQIGRLLLKRTQPTVEEDVNIDKYLQSFHASMPYLEELNATTLYVRIPSFDQSQKTRIDSVLRANRDKILKTENLIIDIRNGTGGSDNSYVELLPFLYTNPIRTVGVEFLSTELNNRRFWDFANSPTYHDVFDENTRNLFNEYYELLQSRLGEFVNLSEDIVSVFQQDTVYEYPKQVGIIINQGNGSTDEQFLLSAKQSTKVKLFGSPTMGVLDISNMYSVSSPCEDFTLWYGLSRSLRIPTMTIDGIGIQPDYYLDKTIPSHKWVEFVNGILARK